ncbi:SMI1/KNR4 family protein [Peribacillus frigoritolerans]|uniref:SMI1/KNR4 family protein n=1 Tax=Peribacillus frigoritolerans TaxID=450367 RepID=UPI002E1D6AE7|nr:SMI1/KNR4 family protein [Peribacillus frigoritolerans]
MVKSIWEESNDEYMLQPLTDEIVKKAEELFNVTLPNSYIAILKQQNGGQPICNAHPSPVPTVWGESFVIVEHIKGIGSGNGILENDYYIKEWELPEGLILFNGDGHTWLAFDYRNATSEPPIVYVDVDLEQTIQIADSFEEFLKNLYLENVEFDFEGMEVKVYSKQDLEKFIQEDNVDELIRAIPDLAQGDVDLKWFGDQLLTLSNYHDGDVRYWVANSVWNHLTYRLDEEILHSLIETFKNDVNSDVRMCAESALEQMNYSFEQFKEDVHNRERVSLAFQDKLYHVIEESNQWHLADYETETQQSFDSADELLEKSRIDGKSLQEGWRQIKKAY